MRNVILNLLRSSTQTHISLLDSITNSLSWKSHRRSGRKSVKEAVTEQHMNLLSNSTVHIIDAALPCWRWDVVGIWPLGRWACASTWGFWSRLNRLWAFDRLGRLTLRLSHFPSSDISSSIVRQEKRWVDWKFSALASFSLVVRWTATSSKLWPRRLSSI